MARVRQARPDCCQEQHTHKYNHAFLRNHLVYPTRVLGVVVMVDCLAAAAAAQETLPVLLPLPLPRKSKPMAAAAAWQETTTPRCRCRAAQDTTTPRCRCRAAQEPTTPRCRCRSIHNDFGFLSMHDILHRLSPVDLDVFQLHQCIDVQLRLREVQLRQEIEAKAGHG